MSAMAMSVGYSLSQPRSAPLAVSVPSTIFWRMRRTSNLMLGTGDGPIRRSAVSRQEGSGARLRVTSSQGSLREAMSRWQYARHLLVREALRRPRSTPGLRSADVLQGIDRPGLRQCDLLRILRERAVLSSARPGAAAVSGGTSR